MSYGLLPRTWRGHDINDGTVYQAHFLLEDGESLNTLDAPAVEVQRQGRAPLRAYSQPEGKRFVLEIVMQTMSQANHDQLVEWFDPTIEDEGELIADPEYGEGDTGRRIMCVCERLYAPANVNVFKAVMFAPLAMWEDEEAVTVSPEAVVSSPHEFTLTNPGTTPAPLVLRLTANDVSTTRQTKMRRFYIANRSVDALQHHASEGYPIEITGGGLDTTGDFRSDLADLRVLLYGEEIPRWCSPATADAATKVWCNLYFQPGKSATLKDSIAAEDNALEVDNAEGFLGWPEDGWLFVDEEPMQYVARSEFGSGTLVRPFPTTHDAGAPIWWIEHVPEIIYDDSDAEAPPDWLDTKPVLNLATSTNTLHVRPGPFFNDEDRRSATLLRRLAPDGTEHIRTYDDGDGKMRFEDTLAEAGKPPLSVARLDFPVPMTELVLDYSVEQSLLLKVRGADQQGYESDLLKAFWTSGAVSGATLTPEQPIRRVDFVTKIAAITGEVETSGVAQITDIMHGGTVRVENPFYDSVAQEVLSIARDIRIMIADGAIGMQSGNGSALPERSHDVNIPLPAFIHFVLEQETEINGLLAYVATGTTPIYFSDGTGPIKAILSEAFAGSASPSLRTTTFDPPIVLPAGEYWLKPATAFGVVSGRRSAQLWYGYHDVIDERTRVYTFSFNSAASFLQSPPDPATDISQVWSEQAEVDVPTRDSFHTDVFTSTPVFAVLSDKTPPQADAPVETDLKATVDNLSATLDATQAPLIYAAAERDILLVDGVYENDTTGESIELLLALPVDEEFEIDTDIEEATALEFDTPASYAMALSGRFLLAPGDNDLVLTLPGVQDATITPVYRGRYL